MVASLCIWAGIGHDWHSHDQGSRLTKKRVGVINVTVPSVQFFYFFFSPQQCTAAERQGANLDITGTISNNPRGVGMDHAVS